MVLEIIKLLVTVLSACLTSGGVVMYVLKKHDRISVIEEKLDYMGKGINLGLENDVVIFEALRKGHINGESERQEAKLHKYFYDCTCNSFKCETHHHKHEKGAINE